MVIVTVGTKVQAATAEAAIGEALNKLGIDMAASWLNAAGLSATAHPELGSTERPFGRQRVADDCTVKTVEWELADISGGQLRVHTAHQCAGQRCCIHKPTAHRLTAAPLHWRGDRGLMERICTHGVGHPDPDDLDHKRRTRADYDAHAWGVHGCDGCCYEPPAG